MKVKLKNVRLAFAQNLVEAGTVGGEGDPAYSCSVLLPPDHPQLEELKAIEEQVAKEKWAGKSDGILKSIRATTDKMLVVDGDTKANYDGFADNMFISLRRKATDGRPTVVNQKGQPVNPGEAGFPYSGCYVVVHLDVWAQDNSYGKRINGQLLGVQFMRDGDSFGGGQPASSTEEFGDLSAEEEENLLD